MQIGERIKRLPVVLNVSESEFYKNARIGKDGIDRMIERNGSPSFNTIEGILSSYPQVNPDWLLLEEGIELRENPTTVNESLHVYGEKDELMHFPTLVGRVRDLERRLKQMEKYIFNKENQ